MLRILLSATLLIPAIAFLQNHSSNKCWNPPLFLRVNTNQPIRNIPQPLPRPPPPPTIKQKLKKWTELLRPSSLPPTFLLCATGGWLMNPSLQNLFHSTQFQIATVCTLLTTASSMVINDIYDIENDKIDHPTRPLPSGIISITEAVSTVVLLLGAIGYLSKNYLRADLQWLLQLSIAIVISYTPILKRIPLVKNISCAFLVSLSLFFNGLSSTTTEMTVQTNFPLLCLAMSSVFFGSLYNELLLDMRDIEGDRVAKIKTLPVLLGRPFSYAILMYLVYINLEWNFLSMYYLFGIPKALGYLLCYSPLMIQLNNVRVQKFSKDSLIQASKASSLPLLLVMLYFCALALF